MGEKIVVGPINKGLRNDVTPFVIDNDSFPTLINAYQWRGRVKRKRGTSLLGRLHRYFNSTSTSYTATSSFALVGGVGNILNGFSLEANGSIVLGSVTITDSTSGNVYTDNSFGVLTGTPAGTGTINYATGSITITGGGVDIIQATFRYYPDLPVMGLEDLILDGRQFPGTMAFDTTYSYVISTSEPYDIYDVSFYKNPPASASLLGYIPKTNITPTTWNGKDYQQFWTTNYQGALWATNGINIPFSTTNIGMQYKAIGNFAITAVGPPAIATITIIAHGLVVGDYLFLNEIGGITGANFQTVYVIAIIDANNVSVEFLKGTLGGAYTTGGIAQYLTNRSDVTKDCLRWYDGDPTNGNPTTPVLNGQLGWVNFAPPLSRSNFSIADLPAAQYYLIGARMIVAFKDRLLFIGVVVQTSSNGSQVYLQDTVVYSQNGTPYYTASFTGDPSLVTTVFTPLLVPANQTATPPAYWADQTGFGGNAPAGLDKPITTASANKDVLIMGFDNNLQAQFVYTGNDILPFEFYIINSELGSSSTFSIVNMDNGVLTRGNRGFITTNTNGAQRIDLPIPDEVFEIALSNNGTERICSQRDFINEWIYFTYPSNQRPYKFPNQTLQYNYRDDTWSIFYEAYTTYGTFKKVTGYTWGTIGNIYPTWADWNVPWGAGSSSLLEPKVIAGNQQGFILERDDGTGEGNSLWIQNISGGVITSPNHTLDGGDYIVISAVIGTISTQVNGLIFSVVEIDDNSFSLNPPITTGTYLGGGLIKRLYVPYIQSRQFPPSWNMARKTRLGAQQYLLTTTDVGQIQLLIFLSQDADNPYNSGPIVPDPNSENDGLIYSTILYTCPESTNLGLTPANVNLQTPTAQTQNQLWHRINTSLIGDTVQVGFTMSDEQMRSTSTSSAVIIGATAANPCVLTCDGEFIPTQLVTISGVVGMTQLNGNTYSVISSTSTTVTLNVDSSGFTAYVSGGLATITLPVNQFSEIELHGFILDMAPSQLLV